MINPPHQTREVARLREDVLACKSVHGEGAGPLDDRLIDFQFDQFVTHF